jgi:hypothetical protein
MQPSSRRKGCASGAVCPAATRGKNTKAKSPISFGDFTLLCLCHKSMPPVKYWEIIADKLSKAGWTCGYLSAGTRITTGVAWSMLVAGNDIATSLGTRWLYCHGPVRGRLNAIEHSVQGRAAHSRDRVVRDPQVCGSAPRGLPLDR